MKKLILIILLLFTTACSVDYKLSFNKDLSLKETLIIQEEKKIIINQDKDPEEYLEQKIKDYETAGVLMDDYEKIIDDVYVGIKYSKKHKDVKELLKNSDVLKQYKIVGANEKTYKNTWNLYFVIDEEFNKYFSSTNSPLAIKRINLNINLPYKILSSNADRKDLANQIWSMNYKGRLKRIELSYSKKTDDETTLIILVIIALSTVSILGIILYNKRIKNKSF